MCNRPDCIGMSNEPDCIGRSNEANFIGMSHEQHFLGISNELAQSNKMWLSPHSQKVRVTADSKTVWLIAHPN